MELLTQQGEEAYPAKAGVDPILETEESMPKAEQPHPIVVHAPASLAQSGMPPLPFEPARTFHIPQNAVPTYRSEFSREPDGASETGAYVVLTLAAFSRALPDLSPAHHVCRVFSDEDLKISHHDTRSVREHRERITARYREEAGVDPPWAAHLDNDDIDFDTADRLVSLLGLLTSPDGQWAPDYRGSTVQDLARQVGLERPDRRGDDNPHAAH